MAGTGAPATDDRGSPFEPVPIRAGVVVEDVLERWAAGSSAARGVPGTTIPSGAAAVLGRAVRLRDPGRRHGAGVGGRGGGRSRPPWPSMGRTEPGIAPGRGPAIWCSCTFARRSATRWRRQVDPILPPFPPGMARLGRHVGDYVLEYGDGSRHRQALRWRFEICGPDGGGAPGRLRGAASSAPVPVEFRGPAPRTPGSLADLRRRGEGGRGATVRLRRRGSVPAAAPAGPARRGGQRTQRSPSRCPLAGTGGSTPCATSAWRASASRCPPSWCAPRGRGDKPSGGLAGDAPPPGTARTSRTCRRRSTSGSSPASTPCRRSTRTRCRAGPGHRRTVARAVAGGAAAGDCAGPGGQ